MKQITIYIILILLFSCKEDDWRDNLNLEEIPLEIKKDGIVQFNIQIEKVNVNPSRALKTFREAVAVLRGTKPKRHSECTFCAWADDWMKFE